MTVVVKKARKETKTSGPSRSVRNRSVDADALSERIAQKAYELWEQRGRQEGNALQDWLDAEAIVMEEAHESRE